MKVPKRRRRFTWRAADLVFGLLLLVLVGCLQQPPWPPGTTVSIDSDVVEHRVAWERRLEIDVGMWRDAMLAVGCEAPFALASAGSSADLVVKVRIGWDDGVLGRYKGDMWGDRWIEILATPDGDVPTTGLYWPVLLHELGHAMGLQHSAEPGVMHAKAPSSGLLQSDVEAARSVQGC